MTFEEIGVDTQETAFHTKSYTALVDYCANDEWKEEAVRFSQKRKSLELCGTSGTEKDSYNQEILSDTWVDVYSEVPSLEEEIDDLEDAYKVVSKMAAEYVMMERAAAKFTSNQNYRHEGTLPIMKSSNVLSSAVPPNHPRTAMPYLQNQTVTPIAYKENTVLCREWLVEHYESKEGVSIPRSAMYSHYLDFCSESCNDPLNPAGFGKAVRSIFIHVQTRRLGNRGASKYHYYGLSIKDSSPYKNILLGTQRVNNMLEADPPSRYLSAFHPRTLHQTTEGLGLGIVLEGFPSITCLAVPESLRVQLKVFLSMYKTHCEGILDIVLQTNFSDIKESLVRFWKFFPDHLKTMLTNDSVVHILHLCDLALYKSIGGMLLPNVNQSQPQSLLASIRNLAQNLIEWVEAAVRSLPKELVNTKITAAKDFAKQMGRQTILNHMIQGTKATLRDHDIAKKMLHDWLGLNLQDISREILAIMPEEDDTKSQYYIRKCMRDFERLLSHRVSLEKYLSFVSNILHHCSASYLMHEDSSLGDAVSVFMLRWTSAINVILRELTVNGVHTFGSFHLLGMMLTDYLMHIIEERQRALSEVKLKDLVYRGCNVKVEEHQRGSESSSTEYKLMAPRRSPPNVAVSLSGLQNQALPANLGDGKLTNIMHQLSTMNEIKTMENMHLYLATPIKLGQVNNGTDGSSNDLSMSNIISHITQKILQESKVLSTSSPQNFCVKTTLCKEKESGKTTAAKEKEDCSTVLNDEATNTDVLQPQVFPARSSSDPHKSTVKSQSKVMVFYAKSTPKDNLSSCEKSSNNLPENSKTPPGYIVKKGDKVKIVSLNTLRQGYGQGSPGAVQNAKSNGIIDSNRALEALKRCLKSPDNKKQSTPLTSLYADNTNNESNSNVVKYMLKTGNWSTASGSTKNYSSIPTEALSCVNTMDITDSSSREVCIDKSRRHTTLAGSAETVSDLISVTAPQDTLSPEIVQMPVDCCNANIGPSNIANHIIEDNDSISSECVCTEYEKIANVAEDMDTEMCGVMNRMYD